MESKIVGTTMPVLELTLSPGEKIIAEAGELSWISSAIALRTSTQLGGAKGFFGVIKRVAGGGSLFMTEYSAEPSGAPAWSPSAPSSRARSSPCSWNPAAATWSTGTASCAACLGCS